jgi:hypothetical protein
MTAEQKQAKLERAAKIAAIKAGIAQIKAELSMLKMQASRLPKAERPEANVKVAHTATELAQAQHNLAIVCSGGESEA